MITLISIILASSLHATPIMLNFTHQLNLRKNRFARFWVSCFIFKCYSSFEFVFHSGWTFYFCEASFTRRILVLFCYCSFLPGLTSVIFCRVGSFLLKIFNTTYLKSLSWVEFLEDQLARWSVWSSSLRTRFNIIVARLCSVTCNENKSWIFQSVILQKCHHIQLYWSSICHVDR